MLIADYTFARRIIAHFHVEGVLYFVSVGFADFAGTRKGALIIKKFSII